MRALILYPLNTLAEDQMVRMRRTLNSRDENGKGARDWLDANRKGEQFQFQKEGTRAFTPISGKKKESNWTKHRSTAGLIREWESAKKQDRNDSLIYHVPCMDADSAEMWDRWSMQKTPRDIMITNYCC